MKVNWDKGEFWVQFCNLSVSFLSIPQAKLSESRWTLSQDQKLVKELINFFRLSKMFVSDYG